MLIIFILSHDQGYQSSSKSDPIAKYIVNIISNVTGHDYTGSELNNILDKTIKVVRKSGHIIEYLILGVLSLLVCKDYLILDRKHPEPVRKHRRVRRHRSVSCMSEP